jgi:hypothetical protein
MLVKAEFEKAGLLPLSVALGEVEIKEQPAADKLLQLNKSLQDLGFEIIDDRKSRIIEKVKNSLIELIHDSEKNIEINLSEYVSQKLNYDYNSLSRRISKHSLVR